MTIKAQTESHTHQWRMMMHLDRCHEYTTTYTCACGAQASVTNERDLLADPYSAIWMDEEFNDPDEPCERCKELRAGAPVKAHMVVIAKDGTIEKEEYKEREPGPSYEDEDDEREEDE
jgi:hypothetical protein